MLHPYTFGTYDSAIVLADILNKYDKRKVNKITRIYYKAAEAMGQASLIPNNHYKHYILTLIKHDKFKIIDNMDWDDNLKHHMKTVLTARYRMCLKGNVNSGELYER